MAARDDDERKRLLKEEEGLAVKKLPISASRLMRRSEHEARVRCIFVKRIWSNFETTCRFDRTLRTKVNYSSSFCLPVGSVEYIRIQ